MNAWPIRIIGALTLAVTVLSHGAAAAITVVASATYNSGGPATSSVTIAVPGTTLPGDVLVAQIAARGGSGTAVSPGATGWTPVFAAPEDAGSALRQVTYLRVAGSSEPAGYAFAISPNARAAGGITVLRGVDVSAAVNASSTRDNSASTNVQANGVTTGVSDAVLLGLYSIVSDTSFTAPAGMAEIYDASTSAGPLGVTVTAAFVQQNNAAASGNKIAAAAASGVSVGQLIALKPAAILRADYHFDECSYAGTAGEVRDAAGSFHATARNGVGTASPGAVERYADYDRYDRWIETSIPLARDWSVSAWFRTPFVAGGNSPFGILASISGGSDLLYLDRGANYRWGVYTASPNQSTDGSFRFGTLADGWHHVAVVGQGTRTLLYVDGVLADQVARKAGGTLRYIGTSFDAVDTVNAQGFRAPLDEFMVWDHVLNAGQVAAIFANQAARANYDGSVRLPAACGAHHLRLLHDGSALTCQPETVTVQACSDAACAALYTGSVSTALTPAGWVGGDTLTFSGGSTTAQLRRTTAGPVILGTTPAMANPTRCFVGTSETCSLVFADSGLVFDVPAVTACKASGPITISAVRTDDVSQRCVPAFASGTRSISFWSGYANPNTGTRAVSVNSAAVAGAGPGTPINLAFDANAQATIAVAYPDAGQMQLNARFTGSGAEAGLILDGTDSFVSVPAGLAVYSDDPNAACTPASAACSVLGKAGDAFVLKVKAACWQSDSDTDLSDNPATPNFRMSAISMSSALQAPGGGAAASLGVASFDFLAADAGVHSVSQTVSEVGVFRFSAAPPAGAYFGASVPAGTSANVGRFTPHHFALSTAALVNRSDIAAGAGCSPAAGFSYLGEPFRLTFTLTARNASGGTTQNYNDAGGFARLSPASASWLAAGVAPGFGLGAINDPANGVPALRTPLSSRLALQTALASPSGTWNAGTLNAAAHLRVDRLPAPDGPFGLVNLGLAPQDGDGIALAASALNLDADQNGTAERANLGTVTALRFGRARLDNAYGSELLDLPVRLRIQHWNGVGFVDSGDDACTTFAASDLALSFPADGRNHLSACETQVSLAGGVPSLLRLLKPGPGNDGWVDLRLNLGGASGQTCTAAAATAGTGANKAYLQGRWSGAAYNEDPTARATFGVYKAPANVIYLRENY